MQKEITVKEIVDTLEQYTNIEEPIIVKRDNRVHKARDVFKELREQYGY